MLNDSVHPPTVALDSRAPSRKVFPEVEGHRRNGRQVQLTKYDRTKEDAPTLIREARRTKGRTLAPAYVKSPTVKRYRKDLSRLIDARVSHIRIMQARDALRSRRLKRRGRDTPLRVLGYIRSCEAYLAEYERLTEDLREAHSKVHSLELLLKAARTTVRTTLYPTGNTDDPVVKGPARICSPAEHRELVRMRAHHALAQSADRDW